MGTVKKMKRLNLHISANVILAASILLRFKSDTIRFHEEKEEEPPAMFIPDVPYQEPVIPYLEATARVTKRKVTLNELISAVEDVMSKEKRKAQRRRQKLNVIIPEPLMEMATSEEDFAKKLKEVYAHVKHKADKENMALFSNLVEHKTVENVIGTLVPLLHLANNQRISMWQEEVFGEIFVLLGNGDGNGSKAKGTGSARVARRRTRTASRKASDKRAKAS